VHGRSVLDHLLDAAESVAELDRDACVSIHSFPEHQAAIVALLGTRPSSRYFPTEDPPRDDSVVLRTDRLYEVSRLRAAVRDGRDVETAVVWRLDGPRGLETVEDELTRRRSYQPLGRFWALDPARRLARVLAATWVRPNHVTLLAAGLMLAAAGVVALSSPGLSSQLLAASALALALVLDTADGHLARLQGTTSEFGRWLDAWLDELCDVTLHAAIAWSVFSRTGSPMWLLVGILYVAGKYVFLVGVTESRGDVRDAGTREDAGNRPRSRAKEIVRLTGHADVRWHLWIALAAIGRLELALAAYALYFPARSMGGALRKAVRRG
jgi:phosphatidylglycerophosphate synthase